MAVVSEPPWLNFTSGTAARNGTTSHTVSFGFTSTSGSLLVAIIHGAVTHTASGWTEQAQPVATGECSLFTKTSAGDSSITVTHNGSNYPINYVIYEFPSGSSLTGIDSTTGSNDTMPALTGLPGTEQVIIGALGRVTIGSETNGTISPSAPWVEDGDLFAAAGSGTDGTYLAVIRQINVTATSITPTITPTYSGTWSNGSREKISAAFDVAAGATPKSVGDTGSETETLATSVTAPIADTASETDALTATATASASQAASSAEALTASVTVALADSAAAAESFDNGAGTPKSVSDSASAADAVLAAAAAALAQAAAGDLTLSVAAAAVLADAASVVDSAAAGVAAGPADTGIAADAMSVSVVITLADSGSAATALVGADASNVQKALADGGSADERLRTTTVRPASGITTRPNAGITPQP